MKLSTDQLARMGRLLDEALELDEAGRKKWLESLSPENQDLTEALQQGLLAPRKLGIEALAAGARGAVCPPSTGLKVGARVGPYLLTRELGHGGMARVWLAARVDGALKREVALKVPELSLLRPGLAERFALERDILAGLEHPNIARLYDAGVTQEGLPYLALEYVSGKSLGAWADQQRLGIEERIELFLQVLDAVQYAHDRGVLHRDIKPSNVMVTDTGQVRLLDFGVAKLLEKPGEASLTGMYGRAFTPEYASPEHVQGEQLQAGSDVYSLGVMLYELLAGSLPHRITANDSAGLLEETVNRTRIEKPSAQVGPEAGAARSTTQKKLARRLRGDLDAIALQALARAPKDRYVSAAAMAADLRRYLRGEPLAARADHITYRLAKFTLRHRSSVMATAAAALLSAAAVGYMLSRNAVTEPTASDAVADKPIAVLPFLASSTGGESEAQGVSFARDLSRTLGRTLSHFGWRVVASLASEKLIGSAEMQRLATRLDANFLIGGEIHHADGQIRVDLQILDGTSGMQVWADRVVTPEAKAASFPDLPLLQAAAALRHGVYKVERDRIGSKPVARLTPSQMIFLADQTEDQEAKAHLYEQATLRAPDLVPALLGFADRLRILEASRADNQRNLQKADDLSKRAIQLAPDDPEAWFVRGWVLWNQDRYDAALAANARAIELDPSYAESYVARGLYTISIGQPEAALPMLYKARDIDSTVDGVASRTACRAFLSLGRYEEAVQSCERAMATDESLFVHVYLTAAYAQKGDMARAADAKAMLLRLTPGLTLDTLKMHSNRPDVQRFRDQWDKHVSAGLRKAGIPER